MSTRTAIRATLVSSLAIALACGGGTPRTTAEPRSGSGRSRAGAGSVYEPNARQAQPARMEDLLARVPGLTVVRGPGNTIQLRVRDIQSFTGNNLPLLVIDGMTVHSSGVTQAIGALNPQDIARVEVVKDPGALAFYGSAAVFGAVLITTKRGR